MTLNNHRDACGCESCVKVRLRWEAVGVLVTAIIGDGTGYKMDELDAIAELLRKR